VNSSSILLEINTGPNRRGKLMLINLLWADHQRETDIQIYIYKKWTPAIGCEWTTLSVSDCDYIVLFFICLIV
jgi:hypothetical protein